MKYQIAEQSDTALLEVEVQELIDQGWRPIGGVSMVCWTVTDRDGYTEYRWWYTQAMIREGA